MTLRTLSFSTGSLVWAGALLYFYASGRIDSYLSSSLRHYALIGGLLLAVLGLFNLLVSEKHAAEDCGHCGHDHDHDHHDHDHGDKDCDHSGHDHGAEMPPLLGLALLLVPLGFAWQQTIDDYSSAALIRKGLFDDRQPTGVLNAAPPPAYTLEQFKQTTPRTDDGFYQIQLIDLFFASADKELQAIFEQVPVELIAQVARPPDAPDGEIRLYRLFITCCNADAQPVAIRTTLPEDQPRFDDQQWVSAKGQVRFEAIDGFPMPVLDLDSIKQVERPREAFLNSVN